MNRLSMVSKHLNPSYVVKSGSKFTKDFKVFYKNPESGKIGSYFHDVPIGFNQSDKTVNMVVEIPRWTNAKMEISKEDNLNPIVQDTKKGKLRFIDNLYPFHGYIHNYGAIPQTWEDSTQKHPELGLFGDNDPLDICDIGSIPVQLGDIVQIKVLCSLAMVDDGELDWKVIGINVKDPLSAKLNSLKDLQETLPQVLKDTKEWFRDYKIPSGKPENEFAYGGKYLDVKETLEVIQETHESWSMLLHGKVSGKKLPKTETTTDKDAPNYVEHGAGHLAPELPDSQLPDSVSKIFYKS